MPPASSSPDRRTPVRRWSSFRIILPTVLALVIAAGWSAFWWTTAQAVDTAIAKAIEAEAERGHNLVCGKRTLGGYPFRLELRCEDMTLTSDTQTERWSIEAGRVVALVQIYDPEHLIFEIEGPVSLASPDDTRRLNATFTAIRGSLVGKGDVPQRAALVIDKLDAEIIDGDKRETLVTGASVELHARLAEGDAAAEGRYDVAASLDAATVPGVDARIGAAPLKVQVQGVIDKLMDWSPRPFKEQLREWQAAGGAITLSLARIDRGPTSAKATGDLALDAEGRPTGKVFVTVAGIDELGTALKDSGLAQPGLAKLLGVGFAILGKPSNIDGREAVEVPLTLRDGKATLGAFTIGALQGIF